MSVCPSIRMEQLGSHSMDVDEILHLSLFRQRVQKIQVLLKPDKNSEYFTWIRIVIYDNISLNYS